MADFPTRFNNDPLAFAPRDGVHMLGAYCAGVIGELAERGLVAGMGLSENFASAIGVIGEQRHIVEYCPNDTAPRRFATVNAAAGWLKKGRGLVWIAEVPGSDGPLSPDYVAALTEDKLRLLAYGWSGVEHNDHIPGADITTAFRVAERGRGKGLGRPLTDLVVATALHCFGVEDPKMISLETWASNTRAVTLYGEAGFRQVAEQPDEERPTLHPIGTIINGHVVYKGEYDGKPANVVRDTRLFKQLTASAPAAR